jgi:hypothetical protein
MSLLTLMEPLLADTFNLAETRVVGSLEGSKQNRPKGTRFPGGLRVLYQCKSTAPRKQLAPLTGIGLLLGVGLVGGRTWPGDDGLQRRPS